MDVKRLATLGVWALGALAALSLAAMIPLSLLARQFGGGIVAVVIGIPCAGIGVLVARRQPGNPLGWIFLVIACCLFLATDGGDYASLVYLHGHHLPLGRVGRAYGVLCAALLAELGAATAAALAAHPVRVDATGGLSAVDNPVGTFAAAEHSLLLMLLAFSVGFIGYQVLNWRRSAGDRRQQLKWLASGAAVAIVSAVVAVAFSSSGPVSTFRDWADNLA